MILGQSLRITTLGRCWACSGRSRWPALPDHLNHQYLPMSLAGWGVPSTAKKCQSLYSEFIMPYTQDFSR